MIRCPFAFRPNSRGLLFIMIFRADGTLATLTPPPPPIRQCIWTEFRHIVFYRIDLLHLWACISFRHQMFRTAGFLLYFCRSRFKITANSFDKVMFLKNVFGVLLWINIQNSWLFCPASKHISEICPEATSLLWFLCLPSSWADCPATCGQLTMRGHCPANWNKRRRRCWDSQNRTPRWNNIISFMVWSCLSPARWFTSQSTSVSSGIGKLSYCGFSYYIALSRRKNEIR